jgi:hypothetical protein
MSKALAAILRKGIVTARTAANLAESLSHGGAPEEDLKYGNRAGELRGSAEELENFADELARGVSTERLLDIDSRVTEIRMALKL